MRKPPTIVLIFAIAGIVILEGLALVKGIDGRFFGLALVAIAGIGGFSLSEAIFYRQRKLEKKEG